jgi:site-specific DNA recombinase
LQEAVIKAINEVLGSKNTFLTVLQENIAAVLNEDNAQTIQEIESRLNDLQQELLRLVNAKADYQKVADEIYRLRELKQNILAENAEREGKRERIAEMTEFLNEQAYELEEYDEQLVRRLIEKITIFNEKLTVEFRAGVEFDVKI